MDELLGSELLDSMSVHDLLVTLLRSYEDRIVVDGVLDADFLATVLTHLIEGNTIARS